MPLWKIYHPENAFSDDDKQAIAERVTALYTDLPKFYVGLVFQPVPKASFSSAGNAPTISCASRSTISPARQIHEDEIKRRFLGAVGRLLAPYIAERGLRWEIHIDETPFSLWTIQDQRPPAPGTPESERWREQNRPVPA